MAFDYKLKEFFLAEDLLNEEGELNYNATFNGEKFKVVVDVNKNPSKKGIKVKFFPVNEEGMVISNLTPEEIEIFEKVLCAEIGIEFKSMSKSPLPDPAQYK